MTVTVVPGASAWSGVSHVAATITEDEDAYAVLGVPRGADDAAITAAFRELARHHHPDIAGETATIRMMRINAAYDAIRTAGRRAEYDGIDGPSADASRGVAADDGDRLRSRPDNDGTGKAGPAPGRPSGSVLDFGRHKGWSIGEIARVDPGYLVWLEGRREGRPYLDEIAEILRRTGYRTGDEGHGGSGPGRRPDRGVFDRR